MERLERLEGLPPMERLERLEGFSIQILSRDLRCTYLARGLGHRPRCFPTIGHEVWTREATGMRKLLRFLPWRHRGTGFGPVQLVIIQPSSFCNRDCDYCYLPTRLSTSRLSLALLEQRFRQLFASRFVTEAFTVVWHAGEPLAVPRTFYQEAFTKIAELDQQLNTKRLKITHAMQTNATLLSQPWCDFIRDHNVQIGVSIDGPAFIHDAHRKTRSGHGTHARTMRGVSLLQSNAIDFHVISVLTRDSLDYPDEIFHFFLDHGMYHIGFNIEEVEGINRSSSLTTAPTEARYRAFMQRFYALTQSTHGKLKVREFDHIRHLILDKKPIEVGQFTPFSMINIAYDGNFSTFSPELLSMESPDYGNFLLGNVIRDPFESVCQTAKFRRMNADIQAGVRLCQRTCEYFSLCGGGAPSNKYFENHSFRSTETLYCRFTHKILVDMILIDIESSLGSVG